MDSRNFVTGGDWAMKDEPKFWIEATESSKGYDFRVDVEGCQGPKTLHFSIDTKATADVWHRTIVNLLREVAITSGRYQRGQFELKLFPSGDSQIFQITKGKKVLNVYPVPVALVDWKLLLETLGRRIMAA